MPALAAIVVQIALSASSRGSIAALFEAPDGESRPMPTFVGDTEVCHVTRKSLPSNATSSISAFKTMRNGVPDCCGAAADRKAPNIEPAVFAGSYPDQAMR